MSKERHYYCDNCGREVFDRELKFNEFPVPTRNIPDDRGCVFDSSWFYDSVVSYTRCRFVLCNPCKVAFLNEFHKILPKKIKEDASSDFFKMLSAMSTEVYLSEITMEDYIKKEEERNGEDA